MRFGDNMLIGIIMTVLSYSVMIVLVGVNTNIKKLKYEPKI